MLVFYNKLNDIGEHTRNARSVSPGSVDLVAPEYGGMWKLNAPLLSSFYGLGRTSRRHRYWLRRSSSSRRYSELFRPFFIVMLVDTDIRRRSAAVLRTARSWIGLRNHFGRVERWTIGFRRTLVCHAASFEMRTTTGTVIHNVFFSWKNCWTDQLRTLICWNTFAHLE